MKILESIFMSLGKQIGMRAWLIALVAVALTMGAAGCGKSDGDDDNQAEETGDVVISLTDAEGDFVAYKVTVESLLLTKASGVEVNTLPLSTDVDFAQYVEMTEFVSAATIPAGVYTRAKMRLNFTDADIQVEDDSGNAVAVETITDSEGNAVTTMDVSVNLEGVNALLIRRGVPAYLTLDFNLAASNKVTFNNGTPEMTVEPFLQAELNVESDKPHRLRGPLQSVDAAGGSFKVIIRPFIHHLGGGDKRFGTMTVTSTIV